MFFDSDDAMKKGPWTSEEDKLLVDYIQKNGSGSWRSLPMLAGLNRCGKSCRLRWTKYLQPVTKHFSDDEEKLIIHLHSILGNKWSSIAEKVPGRTDNMIKNYWNTHIRWKLHSKGINPNTHKPYTDLSLIAAANLAEGSSGCGTGWSKNYLRLEAGTAMCQLLHGHWCASVSLGAMGALVGKLEILLLPPPEGCSSKRVKDGMRLLKDDVEEISSYLDELSELEEPPPMANCWMNEARDLSYDMEDYIDSLLFVPPDHLSSHNNKKHNKKQKNKQNKLIISQVKISKRLKWCKRILYPSQISEHGSTRWVITAPRLPKRPKNIAAPQMISQFRTYIQDAIERYDRYKLHCYNILRHRFLSTGCRLPAPYVEAGPIIIDGRTNEFINSLAPNDAAYQQQLKVVSILGPGCLGKTTLAKVLYKRIGMQFDLTAFIRVSKKPDMKRIFHDLFSQLHQKKQPLHADCNELGISENIRIHLQDKRYLIIIDDLWDASVWHVIKYAFPKGSCGSRIIVTTRIEDVALTCCCDHSEHVFEMKPLDNDHSRELFFKTLFGSESDCPEECKKVSNEIVDICGGFPLATINIASHLANQDTEVSVDLLAQTRDSLRSYFWSNSTSEITRQVLNLSYNNLPHYLKTCLLYLCMYPEGSIFFKDDVVKQWVAEGFNPTRKGKEQDQEMLEKVAGIYFDELIGRRFIQPSAINYNKVLSCTVHDVVHDLLAQKSAEENFVVAIDYNRKNIILSHKVRRLSLIFDDAKYAKTPVNIRKSQLRSLRYCGLFKCMPCIREFKILRVLNLQLSDHHGDHGPIDLTGISELFQLRYLKIASDVCIKLPNSMQGLKCLETLDLMDVTRVTSVPWDIIHLPHLLLLTLPVDQYLLDWIGSMNDSVSSLCSLGKLNYLQDLHFTSSCTHPSCHLERSMEALGYLIGGHNNLKNIVWGHGSSAKNTVVGAPKVTISWDRMAALPLLQRFECSRHSCIIFHQIPKWFIELGNLCILKIAVKELRMICVGTLRGLRALTDLSLYVETAPLDKIIFNKTGFSVLKYIKLRFTTGIAWVKFEADSMPNLWNLKLVFNAIPRMDKNLVFYNHDQLAIHQFGAAVICIEHMPGLRDISLKFGGAASDIEDAWRAVDNHSRNPKPNMKPMGYSSIVDGSSKQKQQPDEYDKILDRPADKRISTSPESSHLHVPEITPRLMQITGSGDQRREYRFDKLDASSDDRGLLLSFEDRGGARHQEKILPSGAVSNTSAPLIDQQLQQPWSHDHEHLPNPPAKKQRNLPDSPGFISSPRPIIGQSTWYVRAASGIYVTGWIMSPVISKLLDKVLSYCKSNKAETLHHLLIDVLPRLTITIEAEEAINHSRLFEEMVRGLKSAFYDMEDILDELEYIRHQKKLDEQSKSMSTKRRKRLKITSDVEAGPSNQDIFIEPSLTLTGSLNVRLKDSMATIEELIVKAQGIIQLAEPSGKGKTVTPKHTHTHTTSSPKVKVTGRDEDRGRIVEMLRDTKDDVDPSSSGSKCLSVIGIYGISGSGKTTLAQHICKYEENEKYFDLVIWIHVSENYNARDILKEMCEAASADKKACPDYSSLDVLEKELEKKLDGKRLLLVLDDIWCDDEQKLETLLSPFKVGKRGSKILATSRSKDAFSDLGPGVARNVFPIRDLDDQVFLELFMYYALGTTNPDDPDQMELRSIGAEIAQKLKGSPLAARTVGGQLRKKQNNVEFWKLTRDWDLLNETTGAVWWSFKQLDEQIRRCFCYCSIFPRRHSLDRDELVKLWVAEGFIQTANPEDDMEVVGQRYFDELLATSFMQPGESDNHTGKSRYLVHDLMYDLAEKVAGNDCFRIENGQRRQVPHDVRYLFVANGEMAEEILELKCLRTLIIHDVDPSLSADDVFLQKIFEKLRKLRVFVVKYTDGAISGTRVLEIPPTICHLKHLRHLALMLPHMRFFKRFKIILPRTLTRLYHLRALILNVHSGEFPADIDMGKLSNLRHMSTGYFGMTAPNIASLTSLQTLERFDVRIQHGYEIKQLRDLNKLQDCLKIQFLGNVKSKSEAIEANLAAKTRLTALKLHWNDGTVSPEVQAEVLEVLEGLCPPSGLKTLEIEGYQGLEYPSWMVGVQNGGPEYLNTLTLTRCHHLGPAPELFECFIHLREFTIWDSHWDSLPDNMKDLRWLKRLDIYNCSYIKLLPELPRSLEYFGLGCCDRDFMESCKQVDHPNWQKLEHVKDCFIEG